jgi:uncharacterized damage-inducible protein DinB
VTGDTPSALDLYRGWEAYQDLLIRAISPLTPEQLTYRTAAHLRGVGETCRHIIGGRARWCHLVLGLGDHTLAALARWDADDMPARTAPELVQALQSSWAVLRDALGSWTPSDLGYRIPNTDPQPGRPDVFTRQWVIWHLIEHDLHHGGEVSEILSSHGLSGLDI